MHSQSSDDDRSGISSSSNSSNSNPVITVMKLIAASALFYSAGTSFAETYHQMGYQRAASSIANLDPADLGMSVPSNHVYANTPSSFSDSGSSIHHRGRRLSDYASSSSKKNPPSYMKELMEDLTKRKKLMEETPPEEVKYWFEYTGSLQVRGKFNALNLTVAHRWSVCSKETMSCHIFLYRMKKKGEYRGVKRPSKFKA